MSFMISHSYFSRILYYLVNVEKVLRKLKFLQNKKARQSINEMQKNMSHGFYIIAYQQQILIRSFFTDLHNFVFRKKCICLMPFAFLSPRKD